MIWQKQCKQFIQKAEKQGHINGEDKSRNCKEAKNFSSKI